MVLRVMCPWPLLIALDEGLVGHIGRSGAQGIPYGQQYQSAPISRKAPVF